VVGCLGVLGAAQTATIYWRGGRHRPRHRLEV
jgi:hypothetical protein